MTFLHNSWKGEGEQMTPQTAMMLDEPQLKEAMALSAGMMAFVDDAIGDIMQALEASGALENTVVCYTSDHGDYLGDYNMLLKGALQFQSITRVPFIWSDPARPEASTTNALASTVDIGATILERAGLRPYNGDQGVSFGDALTGGEGQRDEVLVEYNDGGSRLGFAKASRVRSVITIGASYTTLKTIRRRPTICGTSLPTPPSVRAWLSA
jgi:arylsulfatase A-like enzyme